MNSAERIAIEAIALLPDLPEDARELLLRLVISGPVRHDPGPKTGPIEDERARKARNQRERRARLRGDMSPDVTAVTGDVTRPVTGDVTAVTPLDPQRKPLSSPSLTVLSQKSERESQTRVRAVTAAVTAHVTDRVTGDAVTVTPADARAVRLTDPISPELREAATMLGVVDVDRAWLAFTGHNNGAHVPSVAGRWQAWCARQLSIERSERDRPRGPVNVQPVPPGGRAWQVGDGT